MFSRVGAKLHGRWNSYNSGASTKSLDGDSVADASKVA